MRRRNLPAMLNGPPYLDAINPDIAAEKIQSLIRGRNVRKYVRETDFKINKLIQLVPKLVNQIHYLRARVSKLDGGPMDNPLSERMLSIDTLVEETESYQSHKTQQIEQEEAYHGYTLSGSMWDVSILLGILPDDMAGTIYCVLLLLVNTMIQSAFCYILTVNLTETQFSEDIILGFRSWRRNVAHSSSFMESLTEVSLASRICSQDSSLELSNQQADAHADLLNYLEGNGTLMCTLTIFLWTLTVMKELTAIVSLCTAVYGLPRGSLLGASKGGSSIMGISDARRGAVLFIQFCRLGVVVALGYAGIVWLGNTVSVTDLVLNAVALEFVLTVDELIYESLAPLRIKKLINDLSQSPIPIPSPPQKHGLDRSVISILVTVVAILVVSWFTIVNPFATRLKLADDALCAGELDFVYTLNAGGVPAYAKSNPYSSRIGAEPSSASAGTKKWKLDGSLKSHEEESMNFVSKMIDNLIVGYGKDNQECGDHVSYYYANQTRTLPFRATTEGLLLMSFCESEYYPGLIDHNGVEVAVFNEDQIACCLAAQILTPNIDGGRVSLNGFKSETISTAMDIWNPGCVDLLGKISTDSDDFHQTEQIYPFSNLLAGSLGDALGGTCGTCPAGQPFCNETLGKCTYISCADVLPLCFEDSPAGMHSRMFCPLTCQCHNPHGPQVLNGPEFGCPENCPLKKPYLDAVSGNLACEDEEPGSSLIEAYIEEVQNVVDEWPDYWKEQWDSTVVPQVLGFGCDSISIFKEAETAAFDFCAWGGTLWPVKPMSYLCPMTCNCSTEMMWGCPDTCS